MQATLPSSLHKWWVHNALEWSSRGEMREQASVSGCDREGKSKKRRCRREQPAIEGGGPGKTYC